MAGDNRLKWLVGLALVAICAVVVCARLLDNRSESTGFRKDAKRSETPDPNGTQARSKPVSIEALVGEFEKFLARPRTDRANDGYSAAFRRVFLLDSKRALVLLEREPDYDLRHILLLDVLKHPTQEQIEQVLAAASTLDAVSGLTEIYSHGIGAALELNPAAAIPLWESLPNNGAKSTALINLVSSWPRNQGIGPLIEAYGRLDFPEDRQFFEFGLERRLDHCPSEQLKALATKEMPERIKEVVEEAFGKAVSGGLAASDLVKNEGAASELSRVARFSAFEQAVDKRPVEVAEAMLANGSSEDYERFGSRLVGRLVSADVEKAASWVERLPAGPVADRLSYEMVESWLQNDPRSASAYALKPANPRVREVAALAIRNYLKQHGDEEGSEKWAAQVTSVDLRDRLSTVVGP